MAAILFLAYENGTKKSGFQMVKTSIDRFINKKYFIIAKTV
jgi:hypothetical protein